MADKCIYCNRRASKTNLKNIKCKTCSRLCHPKCAKFHPREFKSCGNFRYKIILNKNWECCACTLKNLPFANISNFQLLKMTSRVEKTKLPSPEKLNELFTNKCVEKDFDFTYFSNETKYVSSNDIVNLSLGESFDSNSDFSIISINTRSIVNNNNFMKFEAFLSTLPIKPKVIGVAETWMSDGSIGPFKKIDGYHEFVYTNRKDCRGGGVGFYVSEDLHFSKIEDISIMKEKVFESLFVKVDVSNGKSIVCGNIYRSPKSNNHESFIGELKEVLKSCSKLNKRSVLMGDLNYDLLDEQNKNVNSCVDTFFEFGMYPLINVPTRITDEKSSVLDHFWSNITDKPVKSAVIVEQISDHLPIFLNIGLKTDKEKTKTTKRSFSEKNILLFNNLLNDMYIFDILQHRSTDAGYNLFIKRYLEIFEKAFPLKEIRLRRKNKFKKPWFNKELEILNKEKQKFYKQYIENKNNGDLKLKYELSRNFYFAKIKQIKKEYYQKHLADVRNDVKGTWKIINSVLGRQRGKQIFKLSINGKEVKNETKIANEFNSYFSKVAEKLVKNIPESNSRKRFSRYLSGKNEKSMFLKPTNPNEVWKILKALPAKSSCGWDEIPQKLIKSCPYHSIIVLTHIFNLSIREGVFPSKMKIAKVIPIYKKG